LDQKGFRLTLRFLNTNLDTWVKVAVDKIDLSMIK